MSYPLLRISGDYAHVEVRKGRGAQRWQDMEEIFNGEAKRGQEWEGGEGAKLSAKHCIDAKNPASTISLPYTVTGTSGINTGKPNVKVFPTKISGLGLLSVPGHDDMPLILHEYSPSGNCYKIRLIAALLGRDFERREYDILTGETRTPEFLAQVNGNGRIPVLQIGTRFLPESNAASYWLADGSNLMPHDAFDRADMLRWMFWEQYNHEPNIATLRFWLAFVGEANLSEVQKTQIAGKKAAGNAALQLMEQQLARTDWMVGHHVSLADVILYAYTHVAEEGGGFVLSGFPAIQGWLARIAELPGYVAITD